MRYLELLASYLPSTIVREILLDSSNAEGNKTLPKRTSYEAACLFADVSGFTATSELLCKRYGDELGAEYLAKYLNSYFSQLVKIFASQGGDVFKFAGDGVIILWVSNGSHHDKVDDDSSFSAPSTEELARRATQSAVQVARLGHVDFMPSELAHDELNSLNVKMGIGVGSLSILHVGGVMDRVEYLAFGDPMVQAFGAENVAKPGQVVLSACAWNRVSKFFQCSDDEMHKENMLNIDYQLKEGHVLRKRNVNWLLRSMQVKDSVSPIAESILRRYVPAAISKAIDPRHPEYETWISDRRRVTILFVNFGLRKHDLIAAAEYEEALLKIHATMVTTQRCIYRYEGAVNKFLVDDKGATLIAVFGLPPISHENDPLRAVSCALELKASLRKRLRLAVSIGISTGSTFCGVLGSTTRKEYSVLGNSVNLAARLMQVAKQKVNRSYRDSKIDEKSDKGIILTDQSTYEMTNMHISYKKLANLLNLKGKEEAVQAYQPLQASIGTDKMMYRLPISNSNTVISRRLVSKIASRSTHHHQLVSTTHRVLHTQQSQATLDLNPKVNEHATLNMHRFEHLSIQVSPRIFEYANQNMKLLTKSISESASDDFSESNDFSELSANSSPMLRSSRTLLGGCKRVQNRRLTHSSFSAPQDIRRSRTRASTDITDSVSESKQQRMKTLDTGPSLRNITLNPMCFPDSKGVSLSKGIANPETGKQHSKPTMTKQPSERGQKRLNAGCRRNRSSVELQAANGANNISVGSISRESVKILGTLSLLKKSLFCAAAKGLFRFKSLSVDDVVLMIQGTEFSLSVSDIPLDYLELIVNEALVYGERNVTDAVSHRINTKTGNHIVKGALLNNGTFHSGRLRGGSGTRLNLVLVPKADLPYLQSAHARTRQLLIERKIELHEKRKGSVIIVSGDAGVGKTTILTRFTGAVLTKELPVFCSAGRWTSISDLCPNVTSSSKTKDESNSTNLYSQNASEHGDNRGGNSGLQYGVWCEVLRQWIRIKHSDFEGQNSFEHFILELLPLELKPMIGLMNDELNLNFKLKKMYHDLFRERPEERHKYMEQIIIHFLKALVRDKQKAVIVIDDGLHVDPLSWRLMVTLTTQIFKERLPLMLVIGTRPMESNVNAPNVLSPFMSTGTLSKSLLAFREIRRNPNVECATILPLFDYEAKRVLYKSLSDYKKNVIGVTDELWFLCKKRCSNNPKLIQEFITQLKSKRQDIFHFKEVSTLSSGQFVLEPLSEEHKQRRTLMVGLNVNIDPLTYDFDKGYENYEDFEETVDTGKSSYSYMPGISSKSKTRHSYKSEIKSPKQSALYTNQQTSFSIPGLRSLEGYIGAKIDRLSPTEQLILKVACMIGPVFTLRQLEDLYPIQSSAVMPELKYACDHLVNQNGMICKPATILHNDEYTYEFSSPQIVAFLRSRMLRKQSKALFERQKKIQNKYSHNGIEQHCRDSSAESKDWADSISKREKAYTEGDLAKKKNDEVVLQGSIYIRKTTGYISSKRRFANHISEWKERKVILLGNSICVYKHQGNRLSDPLSLSPSETWYLDSKHVVCDTYEGFKIIAENQPKLNKTNTNANKSSNLDTVMVSLFFDHISQCKKHTERLIFVYTDKWSKRGTVHHTKRIFTMLANDERDAMNWISKIRYCMMLARQGNQISPRRNTLNFPVGTNFELRRRSETLNWVKYLETNIDSRILTSSSTLTISLKGYKFSSSFMKEFQKMESISSSTCSDEKSLEMYATVVLRQIKSEVFIRFETVHILVDPIGEAPSEITVMPPEWREKFSFPLNLELITNWDMFKDPERLGYIEIAFWVKDSECHSSDKLVGQVIKPVYEILNEVTNNELSSYWYTLDTSVSPHWFDYSNNVTLCNSSQPFDVNVDIETDIDAKDVSRRLTFETGNHVEKMLISRDPRIGIYSCFGMIERKVILDAFENKGPYDALQSEKANKTLISYKSRTSSTTKSVKSDSNESMLPPSRRKSSTKYRSENIGVLSGTVSRIEGIMVALNSFKNSQASSTDSKLASERGLENQNSSHPKRFFDVRGTGSELAAKGVDRITYNSNERGENDSLSSNDNNISSWLLEELDYVKRMLLLQDFSSLVDEVGLDEDQRQWLGQEFTREAAFHYDFTPSESISSIGVDFESKQQTRSRASSSVERFTSAYLQSPAASLFYKDPKTGKLKGPFPPSFFTMRLAAGAFDSSLEVKLKDSDTFISLNEAINKLRIRAEAVVSFSENSGDNNSKGDSYETDSAQVWLQFHVDFKKFVDSLSHKYEVADAKIGDRPNLSGPLDNLPMTGHEMEIHPKLDYHKWGFDLMLIPNERRYSMVAAMFAHFDLDRRFKVSPASFIAFVQEVERSMYEVPYHNFDHACDVAQSTFVFLGTMGGSSFLDSIETFSVLVAALCHDLEHPGLNNAFQIKSSSNLAIKYNDRSVLENHHCARAFQILRQDQTNILKNLTEHEYLDFRKIVVESILSTDMTYHFSIYQDASEMLLRYEGMLPGTGGDVSSSQRSIGNPPDMHKNSISSQGSGIDSLSGEDGGNLRMSGPDKLILIKVFLHCADISNPCKPWEVSKAWSDRILEEFFTQGDTEMLRGWSCSPNMDRNTTNQEEMSLNFIDYIVAPLFVTLCRFIPKATEACQCLIDNRQKWQQILEKNLKLKNEEEQRARDIQISGLVTRSYRENQKRKSLDKGLTLSQDNVSEIRTEKPMSPKKSLSDQYEQWQVRKAAFEKTFASELADVLVNAKHDRDRGSSPRRRSLATMKSINEVLLSSSEDRSGENYNAGENNKTKSDSKRRSGRESNGSMYSVLQSFVSAQLDMNTES